MNPSGEQQRRIPLQDGQNRCHVTRSVTESHKVPYSCISPVFIIPQAYYSPPTFPPQTIHLRTRPTPPPFAYLYRSTRFLSAASPPQVGLHINHHLLLHRQPGRLPHGAEDGGAHRVGGRPGGPDGDRVRHHARGVHDDLLPGQRSPVSLHGLAQAAPEPSVMSSSSPPACTSCLFPPSSSSLTM